MWDKLTKTALVGTDRAPLPALDGTLGQLAAAMPDQDPEAVLLALAGTLALRQLAGNTVNVAPAALPGPAPSETLPQCSEAAAQLLRLFLQEQNDAITNEWIETCAEAGQRVPFALLPALLDHARNREIVWESVRHISGERGSWLARHRPRWRAIFNTPAASDWQNTKAPLPERAAALRHWHQTDPAAARESIAAHFSAEDVTNRVALLKALEENLSLDDEPFLEGLLDERSRRVARAAADLLGGLVGSAYSERMKARLQTAIDYKPGKAKKPFNLTLYTELDDSMKRDTLNRDSVPGLTDQQAWFRQMVASVPPTHWESVFNSCPEALVQAAAMQKETQMILLAGWQLAAIRYGDIAWAWSLLRHIIHTQQGHITPDAGAHALADLLPAPQLEALLLEQMTLDGAVHNAVTALPLWRHNWSEFFTLEVLSFIVRVVIDHTTAYRVGAVLSGFAMFAAPSVLDEAYRLLSPLQDSGKYAYTLKKPVEDFLTTLRYRQEIQTAFALETNA